MTQNPLSRRAFLETSMMSCGTIMLGNIITTVRAGAAAPVHEHALGNAAMTRVVPLTATITAGFLAAKLQWEYLGGEVPHGITLTVASQHDRLHPVVRVMLDGSVTTYGLPLLPNETYAWELQPTDAQGRPTVAAGRGTLTTGVILLKEDADKNELFRNTRKNAHHMHYLSPTDPFVEEPLSPWYDVKRYTMAPPPKFADVKDAFPQPVFDGHPEALEAYWYCWKTFLDVGNYPPRHPNHQAVANIDGIADWCPEGMRASMRTVSSTRKRTTIISKCMRPIRRTFRS